MPPKKKTQSTKKPKSGEDASDDEFGVYAVDEDDVVDEKSDDDDDDISDDGNSDLDTSSVVDEPHDEDEADMEDEDIESETGDNSDSEGREEDEEAEDEEGDGVHRVKSVHIDDDDDNLDEEDNVDEEEDEYYQKLRGQSRLIQDKYHPELATHSIDEIRVLSIVVRDKKGAIIDANHRTLPFLTKYEKARILGERTQQLDKGAPTFLTVLDPKIIKSYIIASMELEERKLPFIIQRPLPNGKCEFWPLNELEDL
jgi:DNA-directed RNA polymerase I, II, and III subunit RPABC2